jgi:hypothetical protein
VLRSIGKPGRVPARAVPGHVGNPVRELEVAAALSRESADSVAAVSVAFRAHDAEPAEQVAEGHGAVGGDGREPTRFRKRKTRRTAP